MAKIKMRKTRKLKNWKLNSPKSPENGLKIVKLISYAVSQFSSF